MPERSWVDVLVRLVVAAALGGAIGIERELRERQAGFRTHLLVCVGSALFTLVSAYAFVDFRYGFRSGITLDPTRIAAQIVTGIGFLGAGAIIRQGITVRGLTTAAGLWVAAAIGMAAGAGYFVGALLATAVALVGLGPLRLVEGGLVKLRREGAGIVDVDLRPGRPVGRLLGVLEENGVGVRRVELDEEEDRRRVRVAVSAERGAKPTIVEQLSALDEVVAVRWSG